MPTKEINSKLEAQHRVDQILSFEAELKILEDEQLISLETDSLKKIKNYHKTLIDRYALDFDIDTCTAKKQLSLGMKIVSFLAALGFGASIFFLFYQFWGDLSISTQLTILIATPILLLGLTIYLYRYEKTSYYSKIAALLSFSAFFLNITMIGEIYNITPSPNAFLVWAAFTITLAYALDARMLLGVGIISFSVFISARFGVYHGCYWLDFGDRPENFFPIAFALFAISFLEQQKYFGFDTIYRISAMLLFFFPLLIVSNWGEISYIQMDKNNIEILYQIIGFISSAFAIFIGIKKGFNDMIYIANTFFVIFLYTKFYDWWWDMMPKYLFFLIIGLSGVIVLAVLKRVRVVNATI